MKFAHTFIRRHVMTILLYILVVVFGFYSFQNLPLALMPSMEVPAAVVYATYPGAGPEDIEQQVTKKLEGAVAGLSGLDTLQSTSSENMAMLVIRFTNDTDMDQAMTDLRDKVAQVKSQLPDDASDPTVMSIDIDSMPVVSVALRGNDLASLQSIAEDEIQPALERLDGVASVDISGGYEQQIAVLLALCLLEAEFTVIHDLADRRLSLRRDFDQIHALFYGNILCLLNRQNAELFAVVTDQTNFLVADLFIDLMFHAADW